MRDGPVTAPIVRFLAEIGLAVHWEPIEEATRSPGIEIDRGTLLVDRSRLQYQAICRTRVGTLP